MLTSLLRRLTRPAPLDDEMREALQESVRAELDEPFEVKREQLFPAVTPELVARTRFEEAVFANGLSAADSMRFERNPADDSYVNPYVQCAWIGYMMGAGL